MRFYFAKVFVGTSAFVATAAGGALVGRRHLRLNQRRTELAADHDALCAELAAQERAVEGTTQAMQNDFASVAERDRILTVLWTERHRRYADALEYNRSLAELLPEATRVVRGLAEHYKYVMEELPQYYRFDMIASKVHASGLALGACREDGVSPRHVLPSLRFLFGQQPLVSTVAAVFEKDAVADDQLPRSMAEIDQVFRAARGHLTVAVDRFEELERRAEVAAATPQRSFLAGNMWQLLQSLRAKTDAELAEEEAKEAHRELELRGAFRLQTTADVVAAINHVDAVLATACTDAARRSWAGDAAVERALTALDVWAEAAERYLADQQTVRLLGAHQVVLESGLLTVNKPEASPAS